MLLITKLINTNITLVSQVLHSKNVMKIIKRFSDIDHPTPSVLSKYNWKLVDNGAVPTIKFSVAKHVKGNTSIDNCTVYV